jgi:hypothetical protein
MTHPLQLLQRLAPAHTLIHVGAGTGQGHLHQWHTWGIAHALLIDADADRMAWAAPLTAAHPGWQVAQAVLADGDAPSPSTRPATRAKTA